MTTKTKQEIFDETIKYIKENGRASNGSSCVYYIPKYEGFLACAVGRCMVDPKSATEEEFPPICELYDDVFNEDNGSKKPNQELEKRLKPEYQGHEVYFWDLLQNIHDHCFDGRKISEDGKHVVSNFCKEFNLVDNSQNKKEILL